MKTSVSSPFGNGLTAFNMALGNFNRVDLPGSINNLSQVNARRGVQGLINQGTALDDPRLRSMAMQMSVPQQNALQSQAQMDATQQNNVAQRLFQSNENRLGREHQEGMQNNLFGHREGMQNKLLNHQSNMQNSLFGHQLGMQQNGFTHDMRKQNNLFNHQMNMQDDNQNFQMHKMGVQNAYAANASRGDMTPKPTPIQQAVTKNAAEKLVEHMQQPKEKFAEAAGRERSQNNMLFNNQFSPDQQKYFKDTENKFLSDPYFAAGSIQNFDQMPPLMQAAKLQQVKEEYARMTPAQKQDFLANMDNKEVREKGALYQLLPNIMGISDYEIVDRRLK
jgi:hypothetical protein